MSGLTPDKLAITAPIYEIGRGIEVKGRQLPSMTYVSNRLIPGCNVYVEFSWIWEVPKPNPLIQEHSHAQDQIGLHIGSDPHNPEDLGAEMEMYVGGKSFTTNKTNALYLPKGVKHAPLTWKSVSRPLLEMTIVLGSGNQEEIGVAGWK